MTDYKMHNELKEGALLECTKDRFSKEVLKLYLKWLADNKANDNFEAIKLFLKEEIRILSELDAKKDKKPLSYHMSTYSTSSTNKPVCLCHKVIKNEIVNHYINQCELFINMNINERKNFVFKNKLCMSCLKPNHLLKDCTFTRQLCRLVTWCRQVL